jgi:hypothetical protein
MTAPATTETAPEYPPIPDEAKIVFWSLGDANKDGVIDKLDLAYIGSKMRTSDADADLNGNGKVDVNDLAICARHQGMTIEQFWHDTVDKERMQEQLAKTTGVPNLPWYVDWILPIIQAQKTNLEAYAYWQQPAMAALVEGCKGLANLMGDYPLATVDAEEKLRDFYNDSYTAHMSEVLKGNMATLPKNIINISSQLHSNYDALIHGVLDAADPEKYIAGDGSDLQIYLMSTRMQSKISEYFTGAAEAQSLGKSLTLGVLDSAGTWTDLVKSLSGAASLPPYINTMAAKKVFEGGLDRYYNSLWTPYVPAASDWIDLYIHGDMTQNDFYREMRRQGYADVYADLLVKTHLNPPSVADALTAWRRGLIKDVDVDLIFRRNRLDPDWKNVFEVRKYNDLSLGEAHTLFDLGIADKDKVFDTARRAGYNFDDATALTDSVVNFPIRRLKLRQIFNLVMAYSYGVVDLAGVSTIVEEMGYPAAVSVWVQKVGDLRKAILTRTKAPKEKEKLLSLGDLKAAYLRGLLTEDQFRTELLTRGYNLDDITILISVMTDRRTVEQAGGKMYALSVIELLNAWRYGVITEDALRNKLLARGLPLDELDALIATKKVQWKVTP